LINVHGHLSIRNGYINKGLGVVSDGWVSRIAHINLPSIGVPVITILPNPTVYMRMPAEIRHDPPIIKQLPKAIAIGRKQVQTVSLDPFDEAFDWKALDESPEMNNKADMIRESKDKDEYRLENRERPNN
jgi:hypothetical protein